MASIYEPECGRFRPDDLADDTLDDQRVVGIAVNGLRHLAVHAISNFLDGRYIGANTKEYQRLNGRQRRVTPRIAPRMRQAIILPS